MTRFKGVILPKFYLCKPPMKLKKCGRNLNSNKGRNIFLILKRVFYMLKMIFFGYQTNLSMVIGSWENYNLLRFCCATQEAGSDLVLSVNEQICLEYFLNWVNTAKKDSFWVNFWTKIWRNNFHYYFLLRIYVRLVYISFCWPTSIWEKKRVWFSNFIFFVWIH